MSRSAMIGFACVLIGFLWLGTPAVSAEDSPVRVSAVRLLGPLPLPAPVMAPEGPLGPATAVIPEIDPLTAGPWDRPEVELVPGTAVPWRDVGAPDGSVGLSGPGVYWVALEAAVDRFTELTLRVAGVSEFTVYVDGLRVDGPESDDAGLDVLVGRGMHRILVRSAITEPSTIEISGTTLPAASLTWGFGGQDSPSDYDQARELVAIDSLAVNSDGTRIARRLVRRESTGDGTLPEVGVLDESGRRVVASIGNEETRPVAFSPDDALLLLKETHGETADLLTFEMSTGALRTVLRDEPELGLVRWHPAGAHLLVASARGVTDVEVDEAAPVRRRALREKVTDYTTGPHLHLLEIATGARRRLTLPGDWVLDDATFTPDGRAVLYARTVPQVAYPWFVTEIRFIDLESAEDRLITTFSAGWESRPKHLTVSPDGHKVAFLGPPEKVVEGRAGLNILQAAVYLLDLQGGEAAKITGDVPFAFTLRRSDLLAWSDDGTRLIAAVTDRTGAGLATISSDSSGGWRVSRLPDADHDVAERVAISGDSSRAAVVASNPERPRRLHLLDLGNGKSSVLEDPNAHLMHAWQLASVDDASFVGPGGDLIDAWWYQPAVRHDSGKTPLIVYYYGGGTPRMRNFSFDFQFFAANGYAVLVMTPRGALGADQAFADSHVNDWGPRSSADILAGIDVFLEAHPEIDGDRIGIYGGSYGGFMTAYLVTVTDRFAAAVDLYGISNLASYWGDGAWGYTYGDVAGHGSYPWNAPDLYAGNSPLFRADRIHTPLLLLHGTADVNVPTHESEQLFAALQVLDRPAELVLFPDEGHGISGTWTNRVEHRTMMLEWFDMYLRGQPEAWNARWDQSPKVEE